MKAIGRRSVASFISIVLTFIRIGATFVVIVPLIGIAVLPFINAPKMAVIVPVSFHLDADTQLRDRSRWPGFEFVDEKTGIGQTQRGRVGVEAALRIPTTSRLLFALNAGIFVIAVLFALIVLDQLRAVMSTLIHGSPFVPENARRIRYVALAVIGGELVRSAVVFAENRYAAAHVPIAGVTFDTLPHVYFTTILCGLIILVIAEVFRAGTRLDEEQSLTI